MAGLGLHQAMTRTCSTLLALYKFWPLSMHSKNSRSGDTEAKRELDVVGHTKSSWMSCASLTRRRIVIANLQNRNNGSFAGDEWGETDTRFLYGALNALSLLKMLSLVDVPKAVSYVQLCANFDGGYGVRPGAESHAGQIFTCVAALAITGRLDAVDRNRLGEWLSERQLKDGGLNGRPEKLEDVCYSWWVGSSLAIIDRIHWIDGRKLAQFIMRCQVGLRPTWFLPLNLCRTLEWGGLRIGQGTW